MPNTFRGGIHPEDKKKYTEKKRIEVLAVEPEELIFPLLQHTGAPAKPIVAVGDYVQAGQKIAEAAGPLSANIHTGVSGTVKEIVLMETAGGPADPCIIIENDRQHTLREGVCKKAKLELVTNQQIIEKIRESGVIGLGGGGTPTDTKILAGIGTVDTVIVNGAECEPYSTSDHALILAESDKILAGLLLLIRLYEVKSGIIAIEANKPDAIKRISHKIAKFPQIKLHVLRTKYPQGSEKQLIKAVVNREVPPGGLPADIGCAVFNVATSLAIYEAIVENKPLYERVVTVSGKTVANQKNLKVPFGTPVHTLLEACGGLKEDPYKIILGGPMMGITVPSTNVPVTKGTSTVLVYSRPEETFEENPICIRCAHCVDVCPMRLMPLYLNQAAEKNQKDRLTKLHLHDCIECGSCSYICPAKIPLVQTFRAAKAKSGTKGGL